MRTYDMIYFPEDITDGYLIDEIHDRDKVIVELYDNILGVLSIQEGPEKQQDPDVTMALDSIKRYHAFIKTTRKIHGL